MRAVELAGPVAGAPEHAHHLERVATQHPDLLVGPIGNNQERLRRIG